jgi:hypothetical protein
MAGLSASALARPCRPRLLKAYRWQYIVSGVQDRRFSDLLMSMITPTQSQRVQAALQPLMA